MFETISYARPTIRRTLTGLLAVAALALLTAPAAVAKPGVRPLAAEPVTFELTAEGFTEALAQMPAVFTVEVPALDREVVFLKGAGGYFFSDPNETGIAGFVGPDDWRGLTGATITVHEAAGTFRGSFGIGSTPEKSASMAFDGRFDRETGEISVRMADKAQSGAGEYTMRVADLGLDANSLKVTFWVSLPALGLVVTSCSAMQMVCEQACNQVCSSGVVGVLATNCGTEQCLCNCEPLGPGGIPECV